MACFALVPSPYLGPSCWAAVASELSSRGNSVLIPTPVDAGVPPYWPQHAAAAAIAVPQVENLILAGHGAAGPLLPAIADAAQCEVATYLFVDADLPAHGASRLDLLRTADIHLGAEVDQTLRAGGRHPGWTDESLATVVPDARERAAVLGELKSRARDFFLEPLPLPAGWPDAPCVYLRLSQAYEGAAARAEAQGWPVRRLDAGHFHTVVDPEGVAEAILDLCGLR
ncbi:MAG TPA: hypothetical protein VMZ73_06930 [Acidimicrobiales bacterium]|nr:hypothetical protein [Acidimicrobiales bacterium]